MKSYHIQMGKGLAGLTIKEHDIPVPGPGEALVKVRACSLNYRENMIIFQGYYPLPILPRLDSCFRWSRGSCASWRRYDSCAAGRPGCGFHFSKLDSRQLQLGKFHTDWRLFERNADRVCRLERRSACSYSRSSFL